MKFRGNKFIFGFIAGSLIFGGSAFAIGVSNTPDTGYLFCVNSKTKAVTFPGTLKCPTGTKPVELGARGLEGPAGERGASGPVGPAGPSGARGTDAKVRNVFDVNGDLIGEFLSGDNNLMWHVFKDGRPLTYWVFSGDLAYARTPLYANSDCTGPVFAEGSYKYLSQFWTNQNPLLVNEYERNSEKPARVLMAVPTSSGELKGAAMYGKTTTCTLTYSADPMYGFSFAQLITVGQIPSYLGPLSIK